jgi:hypothetical protein
VGAVKVALVSTDEAWRHQRDLAVTKHAAAEKADRDAQIREARQLVEEFAQTARDRGIKPARLVARAYNGRSRYRTNVVGWYVHPDRSLAVGVDGAFYVLGVPASLRSRLLGARPLPQDPMLVVGRGAKDGESISLRELLRKRLAAAGSGA